MSIGEKLKLLRERAHKTQAEISKIISNSENTYKKYEKDIVKPKIYILKKLADYYNVSLDYLCEHERPKDLGYITLRQREVIEKMKTLSPNKLESFCLYLDKLLNEDNDQI